MKNDNRMTDTIDELKIRLACLRKLAEDMAADGRPGDQEAAMVGLPAVHAKELEILKRIHNEEGYRTNWMPERYSRLIIDPRRIRRTLVDGVRLFLKDIGHPCPSEEALDLFVPWHDEPAKSIPDEGGGWDEVSE